VEIFIAVAFRRDVDLTVVSAPPPRCSPSGERAVGCEGVCGESLPHPLVAGAARVQTVVEVVDVVGPEQLMAVQRMELRSFIAAQPGDKKLKIFQDALKGDDEATLAAYLKKAISTSFSAARFLLKVSGNIYKSGHLRFLTPKRLDRS